MKNLFHHIVILSLISCLQCSSDKEYSYKYPTDGTSFEILDKNHPLCNFKMDLNEFDSTTKISFKIKKVEIPNLEYNSLFAVGPAIQITSDKDSFPFNNLLRIEIPISEKISCITMVGKYNIENGQWQYLRPDLSKKNGLISFSDSTTSIYVPLAYKFVDFERLHKIVLSELGNRIISFNTKKYTKGELSEIATFIDDKLKGIQSELNGYDSLYKICAKDKPKKKRNDLRKFIRITSDSIKKNLSNAEIIDILVNEKNDTSFQYPSISAAHTLAPHIFGNEFECLLTDTAKQNDFWSNYIKLMYYNAIKKELSFIDERDGKVYKVVKIGRQIWMAENLAYKTTEGCWAYNNNPANVTKYGYLYNWETAKKVCPPGWHLPSKSEFETLINNYPQKGGVAFTSLIQGGISGFMARYGGWRDDYEKFGYIGKDAWFWSSTPNEHLAWCLHFWDSIGAVYVDDDYRVLGLSVRCLKDN